MKIFALVVAFLISSRTSYCQEKNGIDDVLNGLTTIVKAICIDTNGVKFASFGTAFFYQKYRDTSHTSLNYTINLIDSNTKSIWLITNKHVLFGSNSKKGEIHFPINLEFYIRRKNHSDNNSTWDTLKISSGDLVKFVKFHYDSMVDVIAINITSIVLNKYLSNPGYFYLYAISSLNFPEQWKYSFDLNKIQTPRVTQDAIAVGYPSGRFYDMFNLFPTVKSGIIASKWLAKYNGQPYFLIDCKLFPGSSGSLVISKPLIVSGTGPNENYSKSFDFFFFLGIFSGEIHIPIKELVNNKVVNIDQFYNTGIVWYYYLVDEIIDR